MAAEWSFKRRKRAHKTTSKFYTIDWKLRCFFCYTGQINFINLGSWRFDLYSVRYIPHDKWWKLIVSWQLLQILQIFVLEQKEIKMEKMCSSGKPVSSRFAPVIWGFSFRDSLECTMEIQLLHLFWDQIIASLSHNLKRDNRMFGRVPV